jgi:hypothetical protein
METIRNLINVLESEYALYEELLELLIFEKKIITTWDTDKIIEITKTKDTLLYKEKLLEEAKEKILKKINCDLNIEIDTSSIIDIIEDENLKEIVSDLQSKIKNIASKIQMENFSVKQLYNTNLRIINDIFDRVGLVENASYQSHGKVEKKNNNSFTTSA